MTPQAEIRQYDIWWVALDPAVGAETQKTRPCVILSVNPLNDLNRTVIVAPFLKTRHKNRLYGVDVTPSTRNGLDQERRIDLRGIRAVDKSRLKSRQGMLEAEHIPGLNQAMRVVMGVV